MKILKLLSIAALASLLGCGTPEERNKEAHNDKKEFVQKRAEMEKLELEGGLILFQPESEKDIEKYSIKQLAEQKTKLERYYKLTEDILAIDARGHVKIVNKVTGTPMRKGFERNLIIRGKQIDLVNARLKKFNALDINGNVIPEMLNSTTPATAPQDSKSEAKPDPKKKTIK